MKRMSFITSGLLIAVLALASISCGSEQLSSILTSAVSGKGAAGMVAGSGNGNVTVSMNTRGLSQCLRWKSDSNPVETA